MAQIRPVTSENLEAQVRALLPSQVGFGEDLQATNVITPIIDLTQAAQGSQISDLLQTALAFGSQTAFNVSNAASTLVSNTGFYRVIGCSNSTGTGLSFFSLTDGFSSKIVWATNTASQQTIQFDFVVFIGAGESLTCQTTTTTTNLFGSTRQIADVNGNLVYPSGFTPQ